MHFTSIQRRPASGSAEPAYRQIAAQVRDGVRDGRLYPGERLPAIRALAVELGVNRDTVATAYDLLVSEGLLEAGVGRGTFVRVGPASPPVAAAEPVLAPAVERLLEFEQLRERPRPPDGVAPLHSLVPDPSLYPVRDFHRALNRVLREGGTDVLAYGGHQGDRVLRQAIAERLSGHGMLGDAEGVVLCQGASQGISLALRLFTEPGDVVAVEEPTYHNVLAALVALGLRPTPVEMTPDGPDLAALERALARPEVKLFYTMPSFHNPLGTTTTLEHRRRLLDVSARAGKPVVEDGFEMDLRYDGRSVPPLAALDEHGLVVHLFSFSKSLFPGVRIGAISAHGRAVDGLLALKYATDLSGSPLLQAAVARFVGSGGYERHLGRLRRTLRERRDAMLEALASHMPAQTRWTRPDGGYQVWVQLPPGLDSRALLADAHREGVSFSPGYQFQHDGRPSAGLRLTTALASSEEITRGVRALAGTVRRHLRRPGTALRDTSVHV